uniref:MD-2-related lipid-recognition domain-containing protein n=1 Tax=Panagrolaimus sp. ES5 TaxID=591445 RepID=A0AC34G430_9BILA
MFQIVTILLLIFTLFIANTYAIGCEVDYPGDTDRALNWFPSCSSKIVIHSVTPIDALGRVEYPIKVDVPLHVRVNMTNNGPEFNDMKLSTNLWSWGGWFGCDWHTVLTFGVLSNLDACTNGIPCPIKRGHQVITIVMDFTKWQAIIAILGNDAAYQIEQVITAPSGDTFCITVQARARKY